MDFFYEADVLNESYARRNMFMKATKIKMKSGCLYSEKTQEIDSIYIDGFSAFVKKGVVYDYLIAYPDSIQVNRYPYPYLQPVKSSNGEKYVRSEPNDTKDDNLLMLPRE